jgi:hypothetical protein
MFHIEKSLNIDDSWKGCMQYLKDTLKFPFKNSSQMRFFSSITKPKSQQCGSETFNFNNELVRTKLIREESARWKLKTIKGKTIWHASMFSSSFTKTLWVSVEISANRATNVKSSTRIFDAGREKFLLFQLLFSLSRLFYFPPPRAIFSSLPLNFS